MFAEEISCVFKTNSIEHTIKGRNVNWIGHVLRRICLLKHVTEGRMEGTIEVARRRGRIRKHLQDDIMETKVYFELKGEALDPTLLRTCFGRSYGRVVRQSTE